MNVFFLSSSYLSQRKIYKCTLFLFFCLSNVVVCTHHITLRTFLYFFSLFFFITYQLFSNAFLIFVSATVLLRSLSFFLSKGCCTFFLFRLCVCMYLLSQRRYIHNFIYKTTVFFSDFLLQFRLISLKYSFYRLF